MKDEKKFILSAVYKPFTDTDFRYDSVLRGIVGKPEFEKLWHDGTKTRKMSFEFTDEGAAKKALKRLKDQKLRAVLEGVL